jgi:hypothetical protein
MLLFALATLARADDVVIVNGDDSVVTTAPAPAVDVDDVPKDRWDRDPRFYLGTTFTAIGGGIAQSGYGRLESKSDAYLEVYGRMQPCGCWTGRAGVGVDVFGDGAFDLDLGLFMGVAGSTEILPRREVVRSAGTEAGTQISVGIDGRHLIARYTWLAGIGGGPIDGLLTENQLVLGAKIFPALDVYGEADWMNPGREPSTAGLGLGARLVF